MKTYNILIQILSSETRAQLLQILFDGNKEEFYLRNLERLTGKTIRPLQQEIKNLFELDLITARKDGNRIYYRANAAHPIYLDLVSIVEKTVGLVEVLRNALNDLRIKKAFIFGSVARNEEKAQSDVDLVVIGDIGMRAVSKLLSGLQEKLGREINPYVFTEHEFNDRKKNKDHFVSSILKAPKKILIGESDEN